MEPRTEKHDVDLEQVASVGRDDEETPQEDVREKDTSVVIEEENTKVPDGGWGWMIVFGCLMLRTVLGAFMRSNGLFYVKFLERFGGSAQETAWVTSLSATIRLLLGPLVSIMSSRISCRKLTAIGVAIFVVAVHISGYSNSLMYLYFTYGIIGGLGRSFINTPLTLLLGNYFDKRRSLAFGLASSGFGLGGFAITPFIEVMFQHYGFNGTFILLSGIACHMFICVCLFRPADKTTKSRKKDSENLKSERSREHESTAKDANDAIEADQSSALLTPGIASTSSERRKSIPNETTTTEDEVKSETVYGSRNDKEEDCKSDDETKHKAENDTFEENREDDNLMHTVAKSESANEDINPNPKEAARKSKKKLISFSVLKDVRFVTLLVATFVFMLPSSGLFLPALAKSRGVSDIQAAYMLSIIAASDTVSRVISGFILDLKPVRNLRPYVFNGISFIQCIALVLFPCLQTFPQFVAVCILHGAVMGIKAAQRSVILVDILGVKKLPSSHAFLLAVQGVGTLIGPPVAGLLKDTYGKYDYSFYFGGACIFIGACILACGNIRNYYNKKKSAESNQRTGGNK